MFLNQLSIIGRLTAKPDEKFTPNGKRYASLSVAVADYHQDAKGQLVEETDFFHVHAYGTNADKAFKLDKGALVYVDGKFRSHKSQDGTRYWNLKADTFRRLEKLEKPEAAELEGEDERNAD